MLQQKHFITNVTTFLMEKAIFRTFGIVVKEFISFFIDCTAQYVILINNNG